MATTPAFYARVHVRLGASTRQVLAPFVQTLPMLAETQKGTAYILQGDGVGRPDGLYLWTGRTWGFGIPFPDVTESIGNAIALHVYYDLPAVHTPAHALKFWQNGVPRAATSVPAKLTTVWGSVDAQYADIDGGGQGEGTVKSVNNVGPDAQGNVTLTQVAEYSISVTQTPDPSAVIFYQLFDDALTFEGATLKVKNRPDQDVTLSATLDGTPVGQIVIGAAADTISLTLTTITPGQVLELVAGPDSTQGLTQFSLNLSFVRS